MRGHLKRLTGIFLCAAMVLELFSANVMAADTEKETGKYLPTDQAITISAEAEDTVTVKEREDDDQEDKPIDEVDGILKLRAGDYSIARDYQQECMITVTNQSESTQTFYLEAVNPYSDLSLEIVNSGSKNHPMIIEPGENLEVKLSVFAQNAEQEKYYIPIMAYVQQGEEYVQDAQISANLSCTIPTLDIAWEKVSEDTSTLRQKYKVTNQGDALTDLVISAAEGLEDYVSFNPIVSNYELQKGESVEFTVQPDLAKMKKNNVSVLDGILVASCAGQTSSTACTFDTKGQEITVTMMGELALKQDGNPFTKFEVDEDSILLQYYNGQEYVDVTDETSFDEVVDESGLFDFSYQSNVDLGIEEPVNFAYNIQSSVFDGDESTIDSEPEITQDEDGSIEISFQTVLSAEEYKEYLNAAKESAQISQSEETTEPEEVASEDEDAEQQNASEEEVSTAVPQSLKSVAATNATAVTAAATYEDPNEFSKKVINATLKINDALDTFGDIDISDGKLGAASDLINIAYFALDGSETYNVINDPTVDTSTKVAYTAVYAMKGILTFGSMAVSYTNPVVGFFFGFAADWIDSMLDKYQASLLYEANPQKYAALYEEVFGYQCTNRGSIGASFYAPDYGTASGKKPSVYVSSRMYQNDDSYSDRADTNYNITLNGESAGETQNTGVTEIAMAEISSDQLKPGEVNVVEMDYDTDPGHYFVSTETKFTMIYPSDTEIGYLGSPDDLENVRLQPDFEIHPENIYSESELIEGESAVVMFNVYNTGSRGGWCTITGHDGNSEIFSEENVYIPAFGEKTCMVNWTPTANSREITVTLTNTSVDLDELDSTNNSATKTLTVRQREIPEIGSLNTDSIYENTGYSMSTDITQYADVSAVSFSVDGTPVNGTVKSSENASYARYQISSTEGFSAGPHTVTVTARYQTISGTQSVTKDFPITVLEKDIIVPSVEVRSSDTILYGSNFEFSVVNSENLTKTSISLDKGPEEIVEASGSNSYSVSTADWEAGSHSVVIKLYYQGKSGEETVEKTVNVTLISREDSYYTFTLSEDITDPQFSVYNSNSVKQNCRPEKAEDGTYSFLKTEDMYENPDQYTLVISYSSGLLTRTLEENEAVIDTEGTRTFVLHAEGTDQISSIRIVNAGDLYLSANMPVSGQITLTPGTYTLSIAAYLDGLVYFSRTLDVDLSQEDQTVNLKDLIAEYKFQMEGSDATEYNAAVYYRNAGSSYWSHQQISTIFELENRILTCYVTSTYTLESIEQAEEVRLVLSSEDEVYVVQIKSPVSTLSKIMRLSSQLDDDCMILNRNSLHKVSMVCGEDGLTFEQAEISTDLYSVTLYNSTVYLPDDSYTINAILNTGSQTVIGTVTAEITSDTEVEVDKALSDQLSDLVISWADQYDDTAYISCSTTTGDRISANDFVNGSTFKVENGYRSFSFNLTQGVVAFNITKSMDIGDQNSEIQIGDHFTGIIGNAFSPEYEGGSKVSVSLSNLVDENSNRLSSFSAYGQPLYGNAIFTDTNNPDHVQIMPITATSNPITITLPKVPGTYKMRVELFTYATKEDEEHVHTYNAPVFHWNSDDSCTAELTCTVCGEVQKLECTVTQKVEGTEGESGYIVYTATVEVNGQTYTDSKTVDIAPEEPESPAKPGGGSISPPSSSTRPQVTKPENGDVDVSNTRPQKGDTVIITPKPDDGYDTQSVTVTDKDGNTVPVTKNDDGTYTFTQPDSKVTIIVTFTPHVSSSIQLQDGSTVTISSPDDVIEIPQSSTFTVRFTSEKPLTDFALNAGNGMSIATDTVSAWNPATKQGTYTLYGLGAPGTANDTTGIYVNGVKLFTMKVVPRPLTSDTTIDFTMSVGQTYQFWVKPDDPDASYTFNTANGDMLQTSIVKDAYPDVQGRYLCRLTVTGRGDTVGVYCNIDGNTYKLFTVDCQ